MIYTKVYCITCRMLLSKDEIIENDFEYRCKYCNTILAKKDFKFTVDDK